MEVYFGKYEFTAPYLLAQSDCESLDIETLLDLEPGAKKAFLDSRLDYTEVAGDPALRELVASLYDTIDGDDILMHAGAQEAIFAFMNVYLSAGDHLVCLTPAYQSLFEVARAIGCDLSFWSLKDIQGGWSLDIDELESLINPHTRLIVLNTPNNPTGYTLDEDEIKAIATIAAKHGILIFADEVYGDLQKSDNIDGRPSKSDHVSFCDVYDKAVSLNVLSKAYGLPGLRIGWVATKDSKLVDKMTRYKHYLSICNSRPSEFLAGIALKHKDKLLSRNAAIIRQNIDLAESFFMRYRHIFDHKQPQGGPVAFCGLRLDKPVDRFCDQLVTKAGVLLLPGTVFQTDGNYFRIGYGRLSFKDNLAHLDAYLSQEYG